jgi:hypothetical protein
MERHLYVVHQISALFIPLSQAPTGTEDIATTLHEPQMRDCPRPNGTLVSQPGGPIARRSCLTLLIQRGQLTRQVGR